MSESCLVQTLDQMLKRPRLDSQGKAYVEPDRWSSEGKTPEQKAESAAYRNAISSWCKWISSLQARVRPLQKAVSEPLAAHEFLNRPRSRNLSFTCSDFSLREYIEKRVKKIRAKEAGVQEEFSIEWQRLRNEADNSAEQKELDRIRDQLTILRFLKETLECFNIQNGDRAFCDTRNLNQIHSYLLTIPPELTAHMPPLYFPPSEMSPELNEEWGRVTNGLTHFPSQLWVLTWHSVGPEDSEQRARSTFRSSDIGIVDLAVQPLPEGITTLIAYFNLYHFKGYLRAFTDEKLQYFLP